jgi:catechol 2,3-dioxygenase-like lactoylglutathione lyase family enzyme
MMRAGDGLTRKVMVLGVSVCLAAGIDAQEMPPGEMDFNVVGLSFIAIQVRDDSAAAEWYTAMLDLDEVNRLEAQDGRYSIRILTGGGLSVELTRVSGAAPVPAGPHLGLFKAGLFVDNIEAAFALLRSNEVDTDRAISTDRTSSRRLMPRGSTWRVAVFGLRSETVMPWGP